MVIVTHIAPMGTPVVVIEPRGEKIRSNDEIGEDLDETNEVDMKRASTF